jgi:putative NADH-flavin reductase
MTIVVFGATGGTGKAVIRAALARGDSVKAFARDPARIDAAADLRIVGGDAMDKADVARAIAADDRVVVSLGSSQSPFKRMLGAKRTTPADICEVGTRNVIEAMTAAGARRLIVISAFGIGETRKQAPWLVKLFYAVLLREQMADKERQEPLIKASQLDWTIVQPVALTDRAPVGRWTASARGEVGAQEIARADVAAFILGELAAPAFPRATVTLSGAKD